LRRLPKLPETIPIIGVDLGQQRDYTAISILERGHVPAGPMYNDEYNYRGRWIYAARQPVRLEYRVRHLERPTLGMPYPDQVARIIDLVKAIGGEIVLVVDATGVGLPVTNMLWARLRKEIEGTDIYITRCNVTITGGDAVTRTPGGVRVPKRDLISAPLVLMQNGQLKIAEGLSLRDTLVKELLNFRVKINISTAHDSYEAWRDGDHDDLVLSVALACWAGERYLVKQESVPKPGHIASDAPINIAGGMS
jgi:hypothetical protein